MEDPEHGRWQKGEESERATKVTRTQAEASEIAREIAKNQQAERIIHGENGKIRQKNSYGYDPNPPKG